MSLPFDPIRVFETAPLVEGYNVIKNAFPVVGKYSNKVITYADAVHEALDELISDYSDWPEDQGFGSSDMTYARQSFINTMIDFANLRGYYMTDFKPYLKVIKNMLRNYVLWYNEYQKLWYAIDRNTEVAFFGGKRDESIYFVSAKVNDLIKQLK